MPEKEFTIDTTKHPYYLDSELDWEKWRYVYNGGPNFIERYLVKFSAREDDEDFRARRKITYCPAFAKAGINDIKNSIYQRMIDITRVGGSKAYHAAAEGRDGGVNFAGDSMNSFIGCQVLPELLAMKRVGVFVDMPADAYGTLADTYNKRPYLYMYRTEDIRNWIFDDRGDYRFFKAILLRDEIYDVDTETGFPMGTTTRYRHMYKDFDELGSPIVRVKIYTNDNQVPREEIVLNIPEIPFVLFEVSESLLTDIADYQVALLNLASSDLAYTLKANYPFYTEAYDPKSQMSYFLRQDVAPQYDENGNELGPGHASQASTGSDQNIKVGTTAGRMYPAGTDRPGFIHPSSEPLQISMEKQEQLKKEIRLLLNLSLANIQPPGRTSAESKRADNQTLQDGLSNIGLTLEKGERQIARIWSMFEGSESATIHYPQNYDLRSDAERREEAEALQKLMFAIPSKTYQKNVGKRISRILLQHHVPSETVTKIDGEIDRAANMVSDPETVAQDVENGLCDPETASQLRGYPEGTAERAEDAHARRLARIAIAQAAGGGAGAAARGVPDADPDPQSGKTEKKESRDTTQDDTVRDKTRGEGK